MRLKLLACSVMVREWSDAVTHSPHLVDVQFLPAGLHETGAATMRARIQQAIDKEEGEYDYILLGYGLCGTGTAGLQARNIPLVLPRAHDCITLLTGRERFRQYFETKPDTYFRSIGWVERAEQLSSQVSATGVNTPLEILVERYGDDEGRFLHEQFNRYREAYSRLTFIRTGLEPNESWSQRAQSEAAQKGWSYEELRGSLALFRELLSGEWSTNFLVVPPGYKIESTYTDDIVTAVPVAGNAVKGTTNEQS
jgi:hypothetical protein